MVGREWFGLVGIEVQVFVDLRIKPIVINICDSNIAFIEVVFEAKAYLLGGEGEYRWGVFDKGDSEVE